MSRSASFWNYQNAKEKFLFWLEWGQIQTNLDKFAKVWLAKNIFVKNRESLSPAKWNSKVSLMKIEADLLGYVHNLFNLTTESN